MSSISYTSRDFESIVEELEAYVLATRPELWSDFFQSNLGVVLIDLVALVGDMLSAGQDMVAMEVFLSTMQRYESALRFATSVGYRPTSAQAAEVVVQAEVLPDAVVQYGAVISAGATLQSAGGKGYELLEDATIPAGSTISRLTLYEGSSHEDNYSNTGEPNQEVTTSESIVAEESWDVFVGDATIPNNEWTEVENVALETSATKVYQVSFTGDGNLKVKFGDGSAGKIPDDLITIKYRTTDGVSGNVPIYSIQGQLQADIIGPSGVVAISYSNSDTPAAGGSDRESLEELRVNIPAFIRSAGVFITLLDYESNVVRVSGVSLAKAVRSIASYSGNVIELNVWSNEGVTFQSEHPALASTTSEDYTRYLQLPLNLVNDVQVFLAPKTPITVLNRIKRADIGWVDVYLSNVIYDARYDSEDVASG
ncbi:MAG: hypothetical protein DRP42_08015, partial [Tenericutes bacterium]